MHLTLSLFVFLLRFKSPRGSVVFCDDASEDKFDSLVHEKVHQDHPWSASSLFLFSLTL